MTRRAYGLRLGGVDLPELPEAEPGPVDVTITRGLVPLTPPGWSTASGVARMGWEDGVRLEVTASEIRVDRPPDVSDAVARLPVLGGGLAVALQARGHLVLHATAVVFDGRAVAIAGPRGAGKTTLALAAMLAGAPVVADDVVALTPTYEVLPGIGRLRAWPDALRAVGVDPDGLERVHPEVDKRWLPCGAPAPAPLAAVVVLTRAGSAGLTRCAASEAWLEGVRHTYAPDALGADRRAAHFQRVAAWARDVPVYRLNRPLDLGALDRDVATIAGLA